MQDEQTSESQPANNQGEGIVPPSHSGGERVIQPSESIKQELQAEQVQPQATPPATIVPQSPQTNTVPNTANVYPQPTSGQMQVGMSASQMGWSQNQNSKGFNAKGLVIKSVIGLVVVGVIITALFLTNIISFGKFKTVHYDNGKGASYSLKFYGRYSVKNVAPSSASSSGSSVSPDLKELASRVSVNGKTPLTMWITTAEDITESTNRGSFANNDCSKNGMPKAFDARVDYINTDVSVCVIKQQDVELIYIATFHDQSKGYLAYFSQDVDFSKLLSSPQAARDGLAKVGLQDYQDDIKTILASVKPN